MTNVQNHLQEIKNSLISSVFQAANPFLAVCRTLHRDGNLLNAGGHIYQLDQYREIVLVGFGKAVINMTLGTVDVLGECVKKGFLITKHASDEEIGRLPEGFIVRTGNHPVPGADSFESTRQLWDFLGEIDARDLVLCLISGGGSALCSLPAAPVTTTEMQEMTQLLLSCGAEIDEMNVLRKHIDEVKGGGIAARVAPAEMITLILSDVIGSPLDIIASGPTVPDSSTYEDMAGILAKYSLSNAVPATINELLAAGLDGRRFDTPKAGDPVFHHVNNLLVSSNLAACQAAVATAEDLGLNAMLLTTSLRGEARVAGRFLAGILQQIHATGQPIPRPACVALGGETTVILRGNGLGGRNQELALAAVRDLAAVPDILLFTLATDGEDGPTDAAGAWVDGDTLARGLSLGLSPETYLDNNDAYHYFEALGQLIMTGPSGTNVNDCAFLLAG
ncbi:MAG: DUF4147 domain-containing protein [Anaerolineae bacterium]|nr:DUF4147 domain-containing protein [Anaerolineae bacterium]